MKKLIFSFAFLIIISGFLIPGNTESNQLIEKFDVFSDFYYGFLKDFDDANQELIYWVTRHDEMSWPGDIITDSGDWLIKVFIIIDPLGKHFLIPTPKEIELEPVTLSLEDDDKKIEEKAKITAKSANAAYENFISEQLSVNKLEKPSKELMRFWNIFEPRLLKEVRFDPWLYNEFLGWKLYFPVQFENKVFIKVETKNYPKGKTFRSEMEKDEKKNISNAYKAAEEIIIWIEKTLEEGLEKKILILPPDLGVGFPDGKCFGKCESAPENTPKPEKPLNRGPKNTI